jgi:hypothetical protein
MTTTTATTTTNEGSRGEGMEGAGAMDCPRDDARLVERALRATRSPTMAGAMSILATLTGRTTRSIYRWRHGTPIPARQREQLAELIASAEREGE